MLKGPDRVSELVDQLVGGLPERVRAGVADAIKIILACDDDKQFRTIAKSMTPAERVEVQGLLEGVGRRLSRVKASAVPEPETTSPEAKTLRTNGFPELCSCLAGHFGVSRSSVERGLKSSSGISCGSWEIEIGEDKDQDVVIHSKVPKGANTYVEYHIALKDGIVAAKHVMGNHMNERTALVRRKFCLTINIGSLDHLLNKVAGFFEIERGYVEGVFSSLGIPAKSGWQFEPTRSGATIRNGSSTYRLRATLSGSKDVLVVEDMGEGLPAGHSMRGWGPDSDEPFAGIHPADEE